MRKFNSILAATAALFFALFGGCGADLSEVQCTTNAECALGLVCCSGGCLREQEAPQVCLAEMGDTGVDAADIGFDSPAEVSDTTDDATDARFDTLADVEDSSDVADARGDTPADVNVDTPDAGTDATEVGADTPVDVDTSDPRYCVFLHPEDLDDLRNPADMSDLPDVLFTNSSGIPTSLGQVGECFSASGLEGLEYWVEETKPMYINPCGVRVFPPCESGECHLDYPRWVNDKFLEYNLEIQGRTGMVTPPREVRCIEDVVDELPVPSEVYCPYTSAVIDGGDEGWLCAEAQDAPGPVSQCRGHREECGFETRSEEEFGLEFEYTSEYYDAERWLVHDAEGRFERLR